MLISKIDFNNNNVMFKNTKRKMVKDAANAAKNVVPVALGAMSAEAIIHDNSKKPADEENQRSEIDRLLHIVDEVLGGSSIRLPNFIEEDYDEPYADYTPIVQADFKNVSAIIKNKQIKKIAETICKNEQLNKPLFNYIRDIDAGINNIKDVKILKYIKSELRRLSEIDYKTESDIAEVEYFMSLERIGEIVDVYNTLNGYYSRYLEAGLANEGVYYQKSKPAMYIKDNRILFTKALTKNGNKLPIAKDFESSLQTETLELLSGKKELLDYMYEKYYLSKITDNKTKKLCKEINREYGVKVLLSNRIYNIQEALRDLKNEFENWTKASSGKARLPRIYDLNSCDTRYQDSDAYTHIMYGTIHHNGAKIDNLNATRHEIMHLNIPYSVGTRTKNPEIAKLIRSIIATKTTVVKGEEKEVIDWENCKYREEFLKAGIEPEHIEYAYTNISEFLPVAAEGDFSQYSPEFKEVLIKLGMPEYAFNLPIDNYDTINNVDIVKKVLKKHPNANYDELAKYVNDELTEQFQNSPAQKLMAAIFGLKIR